MRSTTETKADRLINRSLPPPLHDRYHLVAISGNAELSISSPYFKDAKYSAYWLMVRIKKMLVAYAEIRGRIDLASSFKKKKW